MKDLHRLIAGMASDLLNKEVDVEMIEMIAKCQNDTIIRAIEDLTPSIVIPYIGKIRFSQIKLENAAIKAHFRNRGFKGIELKHKVSDYINLCESRKLVEVKGFADGLL